MTDNEAAGGARSFRFGVVAPLRTDLPAWRDQARRIADSGFSTLLMPDVQQWQPAPGPTLAGTATLADLRVWYVGVCLSAAHALELGLGGPLTVGAYRRSLDGHRHRAGPGSRTNCVTEAFRW